MMAHVANSLADGGARRQFTFGRWRMTPVHFGMVAHDANSLSDGGARRQFTCGWWHMTPIHFRMVAHVANLLADGGARRQFTCGWWRTINEIYITINLFESSLFPSFIRYLHDTNLAFLLIQPHGGYLALNYIVTTY